MLKHGIRLQIFHIISPYISIHLAELRSSKKIEEQGFFISCFHEKILGFGGKLLGFGEKFLGFHETKTEFRGAKSQLNDTRVCFPEKILKSG